MTYNIIKPRKNLHIARRLYHVFGVLLILVIYHSVSRALSLGLLAGALCFLLPMDFLRLRHARLGKTAISLFGKVIRTDELSSFSSMSYLLIGVTFVVSFFPKEVVTLTLLLLAVGDPTAAIVGILYGKDKLIGEKTLQGALGAFAACFIISAIYFQATQTLVERWVLVSLITAFAATMAELVPVGRLDDNMVFPVLTAPAVWGIFKVFGVFG